MYDLDIKESVDKIFMKLCKKNPAQIKIIHKKINEILNNPHHKFKNLRSPLQQFKRVHIDKHYVLIFYINHALKLVEIYYYDHHDTVYNWRP